ncbi:T9SS type A sorting domain-containing protein [uncultured Algibacter sp.]|uniref:T9SS type A sorting domain-containing protein n=1 Tax=uncultured Algibacter sp. TaxID=298659 RepID=UPI0032162CE4
MKKLIFSILCFHCSILMHSQVIKLGEPKSWAINVLDSTSSNQIKMQHINTAKLIAEDEKKQHAVNKPIRFGYEFKVNLGLDNAGFWTGLANGDRIWRVNIYSKGAKSINFVFNMYDLPEGGELYIYSNNKKDMLGGYTNLSNREDKLMGTWPILGDNVWVEYYEPAQVRGLGQLNISKVIHGYRALSTENKTESNTNKSNSCSFNVNCDIGGDFEPLKERLKHAVALIVTESSFCTGVLINNTNNDKAPYFLTANHCNIGLESTWAFRFNYINTEVNCGVDSTNNTSKEIQTTSGATVLASNSKSDFKLLQLDGGLSPDWDLEWAGWNKTTIAPNFTVSIHHPNGNLMEVSRDNDAPEKATITFENPETDIWKISEKTKGWEIGVTTIGSSGAPLFDAKGRIIGQLTGGFAACISGQDNDLEDWYGRFDVSWDYGTTSETRLSSWLDPKQTGQLFLNMLSKEVNTDYSDKTEDILIYPNPVSDNLVIINNKNLDATQYLIYNELGVLIARGDISGDHQINFEKFNNGFYFIEIRGARSKIKVKKLVVIK